MRFHRDQYGPTEAQEFVCAICCRTISLRWNFGAADKIIPPICAHCERQYTKGTAKPSAGVHRDRREAMRLLALSEALHCHAMQITWGATYAAS